MMWKAPLGSRLRAGVSLTVMIAGLAITVPATAQTATQGSGDAVALLMKSLREKGILSESEYQIMLARLNTTPQSVASAPVQNGQPIPPSNVATRSTEEQQVATAGSTRQEGAIKTAASSPTITGIAGSGVGLQIGDVSVLLHGSVNGFYSHVSGSDATPQTTIAGGTATAGQASSAIRSGFVPGYLTIGVTTQQRGWDIGAHFGFYPGINSVAGQANLVGVPQSFNVGGIDIRQVNLTVGRPDIGEFKIGRDIGLFAADAALNDIALLGMGTPPSNPAPTNSTLGRIGAGYIYVDYIPQITYTTPDLGGFKASVGVFQPLVTFGQDEVNGTPGFQARVAYTLKADDFSAMLWSSGIIQKHDATIGSGGRSYTGKGIDFGAKLGYSAFGLTGSYFTATGLGISGLFDAPIGKNLGRRDSHGYYVQGTYKVGRFNFGGSYGGSWLDLADGEPVSNVVRSNTSWYGQVRYSLTDWVTLSSEYVNTRSKAHNSNRADSDAVIAGAILSF